MTWNRVIILISAVTLTLSLSCSKVTGDLADQYPSLLIEIINNNTTYTIGPYVAGTSCPVYLVFYSDSGWTEPWFQLKSTSDSFFIPTFPSFSTYVMAFLDIDNNGIVDAGEPCTGYKNIDHTAVAPANELNKLELFPLQWGRINITIDDTLVY